MIKGTQKIEKEFKNSLYTGLTLVTVKAINPTRSQLNQLLGKEDSDDDKEIDYIGEDKENNRRVRLVFWLHDEKLDKYFPYSFNLTDKVRMNKDETKTQYVNSVCSTSWADTEDNLADWFTKFISREKEDLGSKKVRKAVLGEEELCTILRAWFGKLNWNDADTEVTVDLEKLFSDDFSELQVNVEGDYSTPFIALSGVRTDENDNEKQYQQIYGKAFLPAQFMPYINKGFKFPTDYTKKVWKKFEDDVTGEYGFNSFYELELLKEYDKTKDPIFGGTPSGPVVPVTPTNSGY